MEKETIAMRFYPESIIPKRPGWDQESVDSLEELEAYMDECCRSYSSFNEKNEAEKAKWTKNGVVDFDAWEKEDPDGFMRMGLGEFNGFNGLDMIEHEIEVKKREDARRKEMHTQLFFYESDTKDRIFVLTDHLSNGYGILVTPSIGADDKDNFLLEVPELTDINHIDYEQPVPSSIVEAVSNRIDMNIPTDVCADGQSFREFIAERSGGIGTLLGEKATAELLCSIGVTYICMEKGMLVMDGSVINVIRRENEW